MKDLTLYPALIFYNGEKFLDQEILTYVESIFPQYKAEDISHKKLTKGEIEQLSLHLHLSIWEIINKDSAYYRMFAEHIEEMSPEEIIDLICRHPDLLKSPIIITQQRSFIAKFPREILELALI
ncbi:ArsC/Spx/MgsR family protein [Persicobacter diffluens]|uniref:Arsenate reductase n=1 Tax=Persicobacter diffluens TaxID=981 RepID=A0AAN4W2F8_9BACT|nr:hypothetical protein PEDI_44290 [Persicobacter diffluens]